MNWSTPKLDPMVSGLDPIVNVGFGPERIRALRGGSSRAAFARRIGVTPQTVYRWELADGAREARRPRGAELARLERLARGEAFAELERRHERVHAGDDREPESAAWVDDDL